MAKAKCWYKNIKEGDVIEVKFLKGHLFYREEECKTLYLVKVKTISKGFALFAGEILTGRFASASKDLNCCVADFSSPSDAWNQVTFLRKVK